MPRPSQIHTPGPMNSDEKDFHIVEENGKWCLKAKSTGKILGCHDTKEGAEAQERAVQANKHSEKAEITYEEMKAICPPCADKMLAQRIRAVKLDFTKKFGGLSPQALAGLCDKFGDAQGFRTRCMDSSVDVDDKGAFCNWLKEECHGSVKESETSETVKLSTAETHNIRGVEIFAAGEWNGDKYTEKDLDALVESFGETRDALKPYVKLGHSEDQKLLAKDSLPAAGWITNIYRKGKKLFADIADMPQKVFDLVKARAYARISSELFVNVNVNGKKYPYALKAIALLGGETPAVQTLDDVHALYALDSAVLAYHREAEVRAYEFDSANCSKEAYMADEKDMIGKPSPAQKAVAEGKAPTLVAAEKDHAAPKSEPEGDECYKMLKKAHDELDSFKKKLSEHGTEKAQLDGALAQFKAQNETLTKELAGSREELGKTKAELAKINREFAESEVKSKVAEYVVNKKVLPSQVPVLEALLLSAKETGIKKFKVGEKEFESAEALILDFVDKSEGVGLSTSVRSESGKSSAVADPGDGEAMDAAVREYMAKHGERSYRTAYIEIAKAIGNGAKKA